MLTVGLTGGIASGKSLAANAFMRLETPVLNADQVARDVVAPGTPALARIKREFGPEFIAPDGALDRPRMRRHVFADPAARRRLEQITHPAIRERLLEWRNAQTAPYAVLDVPILIESGMDALVDRILVIDAPTALQVQRLCERDGIAETLAQQMLAAQATRAERLSRAHDVIVNDGSIAALEAHVARLHRYYQDLASRGERPVSGPHLP